MPQEQIDHSANIAQILGKKDEQISQLTLNYKQAVGDKNDLEAELASAARDNTALRVAIRRKDRLHADEIALRDERIHEVVGFCNEQTAEVRSLKAELESVKSKQEKANPLPFALHMIMCAGVSHYHTVIQQLSHGTVNRETNKVARALAKQNMIDTVVKQPSLYRSVAMYCSAVGANPPAGAVLRDSLKDYVESHVDLFWKDPQFEISRATLHLVWEANKNAAHMGSGARNICHAFDWLPVAVVRGTDVLDDDVDYEELFCESLLTICLDLINHNFS